MKRRVVLLSLVTAFVLVSSSLGTQAKIRYTFETDFMNVGVGDLSDPNPVYATIRGNEVAVGTITQKLPEFVLEEEAVVPISFEFNHAGFPTAVKLGEGEFLVFVNYDQPGEMYPELRGRLLHYQAGEVVASIELGGSLNSSTSKLFLYQDVPLLAFQNGNTFSIMEYDTQTRTLTEVFDLKEYQDNSQYTYVSSFKVVSDVLYLLGGIYFYNTTLSYEDFSLISLDLANYQPQELYHTPVGEFPGSFAVTTQGYMISSRAGNRTHPIYHLRMVSDEQVITYHADEYYRHLYEVEEDTFLGYSQIYGSSELSLFHLTATENQTYVWKSYLNSGGVDMIQVLSASEVYLEINHNERYYIDDLDMETGEFGLQGIQSTVATSYVEPVTNSTQRPLFPRADIPTLAHSPLIVMLAPFVLIALWRRQTPNGRG